MLVKVEGTGSPVTLLCDKMRRDGHIQQVNYP